MFSFYLPFFLSFSLSLPLSLSPSLSLSLSLSLSIYVSLWLQVTCHMMHFTKQHSACAWVVTCILFLINLTFHNLSLHSSYTIHQPFTDYFLRLPYSELLEKRLFRSRASRRLVLLGSKGSKIMMRHKIESLVRWTTAMSTLRIALVCRRFRRRSGGFGAGPGQVHQGSGEGLGGFGAGPGQVQQGSEKVPDKVWEVLVTWCRLGSSGFRRRFRRRSRRFFGAEPVKFIRVPEKVWEALVQSQVQQGSGEGSGESLGGFGAGPGQVQQGSGEGSGQGLGGSGAD